MLKMTLRLRFTLQLGLVGVWALGLSWGADVSS